MKINRSITNEVKQFLTKKLVACHLLKRNHFLEDTEGEKLELFYIRDKEKREVDFAITKNYEIEKLIEVKLSDDSLSKPLNYLQKNRSK